MFAEETKREKRKERDKKKVSKISQIRYSDTKCRSECMYLKLRIERDIFSSDDDATMYAYATIEIVRIYQSCGVQLRGLLRGGIIFEDWFRESNGYHASMIVI